MSAEHLIPETRLAVDSLLLDAQSRSLSPRTLEYYREQLGWFFEVLADDEPADLAAITLLAIRRYLISTSSLPHLYLISLQDRDWQPASQHPAARALRAFFNVCMADGWLEKSPMARVRLPRVGEKILPAYTVEEIHRLLEAALRQRDRAIILCLLDRGCRGSDLIYSNWLK